MSDYIKVQGYNSLVRDTNTNAIINKDKTFNSDSDSSESPQK